MKKSLSAPCLTQLSSHPISQSIIPSMKRNISHEAMASPDFGITHIPYNEMEYVATRFPVTKVLSCTITTTVTAPNPSIDDIKDLGACVSEPSELERVEGQRQHNRYKWLEMAEELQEIRDRYGTMYSRYRRRKNNTIRT